MSLLKHNRRTRHQSRPGFGVSLHGYTLPGLLKLKSFTGDRLFFYTPLYTSNGGQAVCDRPPLVTFYLIGTMSPECLVVGVGKVRLCSGRWARRVKGETLRQPVPPWKKKNRVELHRTRPSGGQKMKYHVCFPPEKKSVLSVYVHRVISLPGTRHPSGRKESGDKLLLLLPSSMDLVMI